MKDRLVRLLRWSEKYTKTDMRYLVRGGSWLGVGHVAQLLGGVVVTIVLANTLDKTDLGLYQFILSTATILGAFTLTGLAVAVTTATAQGDDGALRSGVRTKLKWNLGIVLASGAVASYYFFNDNQTLGTAFLIVGALAPFIEGLHLYQPYLIGKQAFKYNAILNIVRKLIPMSTIIPVAIWSGDPLHLVFAYFASNAITMALLYKLTVWRYQPPLSQDFSGTVRFSKHLSLMALASRVLGHVDKVLVFHFLGTAAVASFTIAQLPTRYTKSSVGLLRQLVLPKLAKRDFPTLQQTLPRKVGLLFLTVIPIVVAYILLAPFVFAIIFPQYPESILISQVLILGLLFVPRSTYAHALTAHEKTTPLYIINIVLPLLKVALLFLLLPLYGIWGAVYAILATDIVGTILVYTLFKLTR